MEESEDLVEIEPEVEVAEPYNPGGKQPKAAKGKSKVAPAVATGAALPKVGPALSGLRPAAAAPQNAVPVEDANLPRPGSTTGILPVPRDADFSSARISGVMAAASTASGSRPAVAGASAFNPKVTSTQQAVGKDSKRKDPRAQTVIVPKAKEPSRIRALMVKVMWASAALMLLLVASTGAYNLYLHFQAQDQEKKNEFRRSADMAELLDRMSAMEAEIKTQRALIRQQETELKAAKGELGNYARTNDTLMRKLTKEKAP